MLDMTDQLVDGLIVTLGSQKLVVGDLVVGSPSDYEDGVPETLGLYTFHEWYSPYGDRHPCMVVKSDGRLIETDSDLVVRGHVSDLVSTGRFAEPEFTDATPDADAK